MTYLANPVMLSAIADAEYELEQAAESIYLSELPDALDSVESAISRLFDLQDMLKRDSNIRKSRFNAKEKVIRKLYL